MRFLILILLMGLLIGTVGAEKVFNVNLTIYKNDTVYVDIKAINGEVTPARLGWDDVSDYSLAVYLKNDSLLYRTFLPVEFNRYKIEETKSKYDIFVRRSKSGEANLWNTEVNIPHSKDVKELWISHKGPIFLYRFDAIDDGLCEFHRDGVCDPDCRDLDPDCFEITTTIPVKTTVKNVERNNSNNSLYILLFIVISFFVIIIYLEYMRRKRIREMKRRYEMIEWIEKQLKDGEDPNVLRDIVKSQGFEEELVDYVEKKL